MKKVILTKPGSASAAIAVRLEKAGLSKSDLFVWPAFTFRRPKVLDTQTIFEEVSRGAVVVVVSPTAAQFLFDEFPDLPKDIQFAAVGEPTAKKLNELFHPQKPVIYPSGSVDVSGSEKLFELFVSTGLPARVLIARGQTGREFLSDSLKEKGTIVTKLVIYERIPFILTSEEKSKLSPEDKLVVVVTSTDAVNHLWECLGAGFTETLKQAEYFTIHQRIADRLRSLGVHKISIYESAKDDLVRLISAAVK